jgi:hypothetical protein
MCEACGIDTSRRYRYTKGCVLHAILRSWLTVKMQWIWIWLSIEFVLWMWNVDCSQML